MKVVRLTMLALLAVTACGPDAATAPPQVKPQIKSPTAPSAEIYMANEGFQPRVNTSSSVDIPAIPTLPASDYQSYCYNNLRIANRVITLDQSQTLRWDDDHHFLLNGTPRKELVRGRVVIKFQWWRGTYGGQRVDCIYFNSSTVYGTAFEYTFKNGDYKSKYNRYFKACLGETNCASADKATVDVDIFFNFGRNCGVDRPQDLWYVQPIYLGSFRNYVQTIEAQHTWTYRLYAYADGHGPYSGGWWTALNYGGNNGYDYGTPASKTICSRYYDFTTPGSIGQQAGTATWTLTG